jgi:hypothetical protein
MSSEGMPKVKSSKLELLGRVLRGKASNEKNPNPDRVVDLTVRPDGSGEAKERPQIIRQETSETDDNAETSLESLTEAESIPVTAGTEQKNSDTTTDDKAKARGKSRKTFAAEARIETQRSGSAAGSRETDAGLHRSREQSTQTEAEVADEKPWLKPIDERERLGIQPKTIDQILSSETDQLYFGRLLKKYAPQEADSLLARSMTTGDLTKDEQKLINFCQWQHAKLMKQCEGVQPQIDTKLVERLMQRSGDLKLLGEERGAQEVASVWKEKLPLLAIDEPELFEKFVAASHTLGHAQNTYFFKRFEKRIQDLCDEVGIKEKDFNTLFDFKDVESRERTRQQLIERERSEMGRVRRVIDSVASGIIIPNPLRSVIGIPGMSPAYRFGSEGRASRRMEKARQIQGLTQVSAIRPSTWSVNDVKESLNVIAAFANKTITDNKEIRTALTRAAYTKEKIMTAAEAGPKTMDSLNQSKTKIAEGELSEDALKKLWERDRRNAPPIGGRTWNEYTADERSAYQRNWTPSEEVERVKNQKGAGVFASILRMLLAAMFKTRKEKMPLDNLT